jgi:hypothetical protein
MNDIDLIVSSVTTPLYVAVDQIITVSWTVTNQGTVSALGDWFDGVYISEDEVLDNNDRRLSSSFQGKNTPLVVGGSYTATQDINFDYFLEIGDRYLLFVADGASYPNQSETNENNNRHLQKLNMRNLKPL